MGATNGCKNNHSHVTLSSSRIFVPTLIPHSMSEPPQILRIKRKRGQDPLQALILEDRKPKKSKPSSRVSSRVPSEVPSPSEEKSWYFQLARTDNVTDQTDLDVVASVLAESASQDARRFVIPKQQTVEDSIIPHELADMVDSFLHVGATTTRKKRRGGQAVPELELAPEQPEPVETQDLVDDYVFDVYKLATTEPLTNANFPQSQIGYIRFFDDDAYELMQSDDDKDSVYSDDEDSNAESFYQNDYPEDEDAGAFSETYDDDEDVPVMIMENAEAVEGHAYLQGKEPIGEYDELYDEFFDESGDQKVDFLNDDFYENDETFERQKFFSGEEDDGMAIHRDRIFGRLQKMIDDQ